MATPDIIDAQLQFRGEFNRRSKTDLVVLHHAAASSCTIHDVHRWHLNNGWLGCGYHYFVDKTGEIHRGRPEDAVGAHVTGLNGQSIGVCAEGDFSTDVMLEGQKNAIIRLLKWVVQRYPGIVVKGHRELVSTQCPGKNYPFEEIVHVVTGTPIVGLAQATAEQAQAWARARGAAQVFIDLAPIYWEQGPSCGSVRPEVAYAQSAKETAFGRFGGVIPGPEWHNWCGLKTTQGGGNYDPNAHAKFADDLTGVQAHLDHLALYAGAPGYPLPGTPDPRHFPYLAGTAPAVESLSGKWAGAGYGESIVKDYLAGLLATPAPETQNEDHEKEQLRKENDLLRDQVLALTVQRDTLLEKIEQARTALTI